MSQVATSHQRLHDLDALRAAAMLLGIFYHVALSFALGFPWMVQDNLLTRENHTIRYLSDSSYWLYLAHLPLCIAGQAVISHWPLPVWVKLPLLSVMLIAFLLLTYHFLVRYTWLGRLLNGPRKRPGESASAPRPTAAAA